MKEEKRAEIQDIATIAAQAVLDNRTPGLAIAVAAEVEKRMDKRFYSKSKILLSLLIAVSTITSSVFAIWVKYPQIPHNILKPIPVYHIAKKPEVIAYVQARSSTKIRCSVIPAQKR